jgi:hypothetical protein
MRSSVALACTSLVLLAGCATPPPKEYHELKEIYVEAAVVTTATALRQVPFPVAAEAEPGVFVVVRSLRHGAVEAQQKLARALGQWPPPGTSVDDPALAATSPQLDLSDFTATDPAVILLTLAQIEQREESGCYIGHSAYAGLELDTGGREVIHHLRLLLVNREEQMLRVRPGDLSVDIEGIGALSLLAATNESGSTLEVLEVDPHDQALMHAFFTCPQVPPTIRVTWRVLLVEPTDDFGSRTNHDREWTFDARLQRRYVLTPGIVSGLEDAVARRLRLPVAPARRGDPWREPRMEPVGR